MENKVLVCGGRHYTDKYFVFTELNKIKPTHIIHGGATGADLLAGQYAERNNIPATVFPADWDTHGKKAGPIRNEQMAQAEPNVVVAFPGGIGTNSMISIARRYNIPVIDLR